jgi:lipid-A-disaccharide synthase
LRVGIIVGEASGDLLGAALIQQFQKMYPDVSFEGVLGPRLKALGGKALYDSERLAVMGFIEPLKRLPELLRMRRRLCRHFIKNPPDVFIGIDAPDFTLSIERKLKQAGIRTVHYVSPSVWAWRQGRIKTIKKAVDLMLVLFPFEEDFYRQHDVPVAFVGHPMAREISTVLSSQETIATETLLLPGGADRRMRGSKSFQPTLSPSSVGEGSSRYCQQKSAFIDLKKILAILPGSRHSEIAHMAPIFLQTALKLKQTFPDLQLLSPMASHSIREHFLKIKASIAPSLDMTLVDGQADEVLATADCALITSGTATLQAMLHQCPMIVGFNTSAFNAWLIRKLYKHRFFALPNILCNTAVVPEYFQEAMTVDQLYQGVKKLLLDEKTVQTMTQEFVKIHTTLREPAPDAAAQAVIRFLAEKCAANSKI